MSKHLVKSLAALLGVCTAFCTGAPLSAAAADAQEEQQRFETAKAAFMEQLAEMMCARGYSADEVQEMQRTYTSRPVNDYLYACYAMNGISSASGYIGASVLYEPQLSYVRIKDYGMHYVAGYSVGSQSSDTVNFAGNLNSNFTLSTPGALALHFTVNSGNGLPYSINVYLAGTPDPGVCSSFLYNTFELGDVDQDGVISSDDIQKISDHVVKMSIDLPDPNWTYLDSVYGDVNGDGALTIADAAIVSTYVYDSSKASIWAATPPA